MTALLELKDIRRSYPSGDGPVEVLKGISLRTATRWRSCVGSTSALSSSVTICFLTSMPRRT